MKTVVMSDRGEKNPDRLPHSMRRNLLRGLHHVTNRLRVGRSAAELNRQWGYLYLDPNTGLVDSVVEII